MAGSREYFQLLKELEAIKSPLIKAIVNHLLEQDEIVSSYIYPWSNVTVKWVYFKIELDIDSLKTQFDKGNQLEYHENTDPKSGIERGLVDKSTGEGVMGL